MKKIKKKKMWERRKIKKKTQWKMLSQSRVQNIKKKEEKGDRKREKEITVIDKY